MSPRLLRAVRDIGRDQRCDSQGLARGAASRGSHPRPVLGGLIQAASPLTDPAVPIDQIVKASIDVHIPLIEEAGKRGVQILGLQEVFNGPYFCPSQDAHWYDIAEAVPGGPTCALMQGYAKQYQMAMIVPVYEREQAGVYYNTAAVFDNTLVSREDRKNHIPHTSGSGDVFLHAGNLGNRLSGPVSEDRVYILRPPLPEGARC